MTSGRHPERLLIAAVILCLVALSAGPVLAQIAHHPFAVGANEGAVGSQNGFGAWILAQESSFYRGLTGAIRSAKAGDGLALLVGLSFAYGVFHAAGPGHGKAVITSYMVSNEVALKRGFAIALAAALLQGAIATAIVGVAAFVFDATAPRMTKAAQIAELASYLGILALGLVLVWRKGRALVQALRPAVATPPLAFATTGPALATWPRKPPSGRFVADDGHRHSADCGCQGLMPPSEIAEAARFDWKTAAGAILTAGARPCSGAILVLVFALSQGVLIAGVAATFAMALGTALTTGLLASVAVFAKDAALRLAAGRASTLIVGRLVEFAAAACVLALGVILLAAAFSGLPGSA